MYQYKTKGTCSQMIYFDLEDGKVRNVQFLGGCNGNLKGIGQLVEGMDVDDVIARLEGTEDVPEEILQQYTDPESPKYEQMIEEIRKELNFTSLHYNRLDDMLDAVGIPKENMCTYCWDGRE